MANSPFFGWIQAVRSLRALKQWLVGCAGLGILTFYGIAFGAHLPTMSFLYLLLVMTVATLGGFWSASLTSLVAVLCLDYYFTPPIFTLNVTETQDWVTLGAFEATAIVISRLSARELRNARETEAHRAGMEQLYELSRSTLLLDLRQPPGPQLVVLIQRIFNADAVALFDLNLARQDRVGGWDPSEENLAKECYFRDKALQDLSTFTSQRVLRAGARPVGALVVRGRLSQLVVDALAALCAIALDRQQSFEKETRAEMARQSEQMRATVMDALAHAFKTPLTAVQAASSGLLELGGLTGSQSSLVSLIDGEAVRMNVLCTQLLKTAKLNPAQVDLETAEVKVKDLISEVLTREHVNGTRNIVQVEVDNPALTVQVDRALFAMILTQFLDNARKYSTAGSPIKIEACSSHSEMILSVHNFGPTIPIEDRERIFERFYRSPDLKDSVPGTGVGLSVVRKAAEAHHGHAWVISDDKEGTTFFLSLPNGAKGKK